MPKITMHWENAKGRQLSGGTIHLAKNAEDLSDNVRRLITGEFLYHQDGATAFAKVNAPWTDRTGAARAGLHTSVHLSPIGTPNHWELIVAHSVFYGIYLEVCNSGKYQILLPTVKYIGPVLLRRMEHALNRIEAVK